jgi:hypothetical protein
MHWQPEDDFEKPPENHPSETVMITCIRIIPIAVLACGAAFSSAEELTMRRLFNGKDLTG